MRARAVEQVFVRWRGGRVEVALVLENPAGARTREMLMAPTNDAEAAVRLAARSLARRGLRPAARVRLRVERQGSMRDDAGLLEIFLRVLSDESDAEPEGEEADPWA